MALSDLPHIDFTRTTTRFRGWNQVEEQFKRVGYQVAGINFTHLALSVLCIFTIRSLHRVSFFTTQSTFQTSSNIYICTVLYKHRVYLQLNYFRL